MFNFGILSFIFEFLTFVFIYFILKAFNYNDTYFENSYPREDTYIVKINCTGLTNWLYLEFEHFVQKELYGIGLTKPGAVARQPYYIEWKLEDGSSVEQIDLYVDDVLDLGVTWDPVSLIGRSTYKPDGDFEPGVHTVLVNMSNVVSQVIPLDNLKCIV